MNFEFLVLYNDFWNVKLLQGSNSYFFLIEMGQKVNKSSSSYLWNNYLFGVDCELLLNNSLIHSLSVSCKLIYHERVARVIYQLTTNRQTVNYYSTIH